MNDKATPHGVGGWLRFLVVVLMVINPLVGIGLNINDIENAESLRPHLAGLAEWQKIKLVV